MRATGLALVGLWGACALALGCSPAPSPRQPPPQALALAVVTVQPPVATTEPPTIVTEAPLALLEPDAPPVIAPLAVKVLHDKPVLVVRGETTTPIIYLHGRCGDPTAFAAWAQHGRAFGTIVSLTGDQKCKSGSRTRWGDDVAALDRRVTKAIAAVEAELGVELDEERRIVIGYSQGSLKAEALATRFPKRYPRAVLIAGPRAPRDESLRKTEAVLIMVGDHDAREHLREAAKKLERRGRPVRYLELPGARHGEYGPRAEPTMSEGLGWLLETPSPFDRRSTDSKIPRALGK